MKMKTNLTLAVTCAIFLIVGGPRSNAEMFEIVDQSQLNLIDGGQTCSKCIKASRTACSYNPNQQCQTDPAVGAGAIGVVCRSPGAPIYRAVGQRLKDEFCLNSPNPNDNCSIADASFCVDEQTYLCTTDHYTQEMPLVGGMTITRHIWNCASVAMGSAYQAGTRKKGTGQHCP